MYKNQMYKNQLQYILNNVLLYQSRLELYPASFGFVLVDAQLLHSYLCAYVGSWSYLSDECKFFDSYCTQLFEILDLEPITTDRFSQFLESLQFDLELKLKEQV